MCVKNKLILATGVKLIFQFENMYLKNANHVMINFVQQVHDFK